MTPDTHDRSFFTVNVIGALVLGLIIGFLIGAYYAKHDAREYDSKTSMMDQNATTTDTATSGAVEDLKYHPTSGNSEVSMTLKKAGNNVVLATAHLDKTYWVTVRDSSKDVSYPYILGARRLSAGDYKDVSVALSRNTEAGKNYEVVLYKDTGGPFNYDSKNLVAVTDTSSVLFSFQAE